MQIARVIGDVVASRKEPAFEGIPLLIIQPLAPDGQPVGRPVVAVDSVGAGVGEHVFFVRGKEASFPFHPIEVPADATQETILAAAKADEKVQSFIAGKEIKREVYVKGRLVNLVLG